MWRIRLQEMQNVDDRRQQQEHQQQRRRLAAPVCKLQRQDRVVRRRMSICGLRSVRPTTGSSGLLDSLPRLFSRLVASISRSLAFLASSDTPTTASSSSREPHHTSLEDEVDWIINWCRPIFMSSHLSTRCHRRRSSVNIGGKTFLPENIEPGYEKLTNCPNLHDCPKNILSQIEGGGMGNCPIPRLLRLCMLYSVITS